MSANLDNYFRRQECPQENIDKITSMYDYIFPECREKLEQILATVQPPVTVDEAKTPEFKACVDNFQEIYAMNERKRCTKTNLAVMRAANDENYSQAA